MVHPLKISYLALLGGLALIASSPATADPPYAITKTVPLGAPDRWDYVVFDRASHRVYVAHGDRLTVVDSHDGTVVGEVVGAPGGTHGIGISTATGKGYTDDGKAGQVVVFDLASLKIRNTIPADPDADGIAFDGLTGHVFVIEGDSATVAVVDPATDTVVARIPGGGKLEYGVSDDSGHVYVNGEENRDIVRIDTRANKVDAHWPIPNCVSPHGMAIDTVTHRLFSSCVNGLMVVVDTTSGKTVASVPIGRGTDAAAFDPRRKRVFSSNGADGTISVIQQTGPDSYAPLATLPTQVTGRTMDVDPDTGRLFVAAAQLDPGPTPGAPPRRRPGSLALIFLDPAS
jgi:YVTN family beta-propeller protein